MTWAEKKAARSTKSNVSEFELCGVRVSSLSKMCQKNAVDKSIQSCGQQKIAIGKNAAEKTTFEQ